MNSLKVKIMVRIITVALIVVAVIFLYNYFFSNHAEIKAVEQQKEIYIDTLKVKKNELKKVVEKAKYTTKKVRRISKRIDQKKAKYEKNIDDSSISDADIKRFIAKYESNNK